MRNRDCGCTSNTKKFSSSGSCCSTPVQSAPAACCESHNTIYKNTICLYVTCNVTTTEDPFFLTFSNSCGNNIPLNASEVFFYHAAAGYMRIRGFNGTSYEVELVDPTKTSIFIETEDCILVTVGMGGSSVIVGSTRCLAGQFVVPAEGETETIYIFNGTGIPIGSILTFSVDGELGSYQVQAFISAVGTVYAYTVLNSGGGHVPGSIFDGGEPGTCSIPIEIITDVDICDLPTIVAAESLTGCNNGSPGAYIPEALGAVPFGVQDGEDIVWGQQQGLLTRCCVTLDGCLKFSGDTCPTGSDTVILRDTGIECFEAALAKAEAAQNNLVLINGDFKVVVTDYNSGTQAVTLIPVEDTDLPITQYDAGDQFCLVDCCEQCSNGPQVTPQIDLVGEDATVFAFEEDLEYLGDGTDRHYLIGFNQAGSMGVQQLNTGYDDLGVFTPRHEDRLLLRSKICNTSPNGCDQLCEIFFNYQLNFHFMITGLRAHWEIGHFVRESNTLADNTTINPFFFISSQAKDSGYVDGPSEINTNVIDQSSLGYGNAGNTKVFPNISGGFKDFFKIPKCDCANSITWVYVMLRYIGEPVSDDTVTMQCSVRRFFRKSDMNITSVPLNDPDLEGFNEDP